MKTVLVAVGVVLVLLIVGTWFYRHLMKAAHKARREQER